MVASINRNEELRGALLLSEGHSLIGRGGSVVMTSSSSSLCEIITGGTVGLSTKPEKTKVKQP